MDGIAPELTEEEKKILEGEIPGEPVQDEPSLQEQEERVAEEMSPEPEEESADVETAAEEADDSQTDETEEEDAAARKRKEPKKVPLKALQEERQKRKELQEQLKQLQAQMQAFQQQMQQPQEGNQEGEAEQPPNPEEDPLGYIEYVGKQQQKTEQEIRQMQQQYQVNAMLQHGEQLAAQYRQQVGPEIYDKAFDHVVQSRANELKAYGYPEEAVQQMLQQELMAGMLTALQTGRNPGELLMEFAKARGFNPEAIKEQLEAPKKKAEMIQKGQAHSRSLVDGGKGNTAPLSAEKLANMSQEEFEAYVRKSGKSIDEILAEIT